MQTILNINLSTNEIYISRIENNSRLLAENDDLIFHSPLLCGYGIIGVNRVEVLTEGIVSKAGGYFSHYMKCNGYDYISIKGKAKEPVYINIDKEKVEVCDAKNIYNLNPKETEKIIRKIVGYDIETAQIGVAGISEVDFARIMFGREKSCGKNGLGKLMGKKKIKCIALKKHTKLSQGNSEKINEINKYICERMNANSIDEYFEKNNNCFGCNINCKSTDVKKLQKMNLSKDDCIQIHNICNKYGMDSLIFSSFIEKDEYEELAKDIVKEGNKDKYLVEIKKKKEKKEDIFDELGFCKFITNKNVILEKELEYLVKHINDKSRG
ncbi:MAG: aldehyde ferredoxin oxidoreductase N-terminal domain-containing protein [Romboutsia sp.]